MSAAQNMYVLKDLETTSVKDAACTTAKSLKFYEYFSF